LRPAAYKIESAVSRPQSRIVGIDLGTTHTVVAEAVAGVARVLPVAQLVAPGEIDARPLLPSFLYAPGPGETAADAWGDAPWVIGAHARARGLEVPTRLVSSAKSWLSHASVDRLAAVLPWAAPDDSPKLSPVDASAKILAHVRCAYDATRTATSLARERIVLTVPASFDQVARELTLLAARRAGLEVRLLEEPQAAVYDYLASGGQEDLTRLVASEGETLVLVCDIGGGTTDLTLLSARLDACGALDMERIAVGKHLLLGGDNMDLALAHAVEARLLDPPDRLDPVRFSQVVMACRNAKEQLLAPAPEDSAPIRILGRGSSLVGSTLKAELGREEAERVVVDGFFAEVAADAEPRRGGAALVGFGLPYERDPVVTRHVATFLRKHAPPSGRALALLLNGGLFRSSAIAERLRSVVSSWRTGPVTVLRGTDPDLAVARGAVAYGLALDGHGLCISSGSARGYYVGLGDRRETPRRALCVVPRAAKEGVRSHVSARGLSVVVGRPVRFDLFASDEAIHEAGAVVDVDSAKLEALPHMATTLGSSKSSGTPVTVDLEGELTPVGTLEIACMESGGDGRQYRLAFELRAESRATEPPKSRRALSRLEEGLAIARRFEAAGSGDVRIVKDLLRDLERVLGDRTDWPTDVTRALFDVLAVDVKARRRSMDHERVFWMLAGFCLRPGYGCQGDDRRVARIANLFADGVAFKDENRVWQQFFIAWRRVAGGLHQKTQEQIRALVDPFLAPAEARKKKPKSFRPLAADEMLEMASMLERVTPEERAALGGWLLERTWTSRDPRLWSAIGRLGARVSAYASAHHIVPAATVEGWLDHLLREKWEDVPTAPRAAFWMARMTGDRTRDVRSPLRNTVAARLETIGRTTWANALRDVVPLEDDDRAEVFGEALPAGLRLDEPIED
jgi:molecular chaperone DnaK (HSP70)